MLKRVFIIMSAIVIVFALTATSAVAAPPTVVVNDVNLTTWWNRDITYPWTLDSAILDSQVKYSVIGETDSVASTVSFHRNEGVAVDTRGVAYSVVVANKSKTTQSVNLSVKAEAKVGKSWVEIDTVPLNTSQMPSLAPGETYWYEGGINHDPVAGASSYRLVCGKAVKYYTLPTAPSIQEIDEEAELVWLTPVIFPDVARFDWGYYDTVVGESMSPYTRVHDYQIYAGAPMVWYSGWVNVTLRGYETKTVYGYQELGFPICSQ